MRRVFQILAKFLGVLILLGMPALLAYLQFVGFDAEWRAKVAQALGGPNFEVTIGRLTFRPFEGIVAEDVTLRRRGESPRQLAQLDRLAVSPNLAELLSGRVSIDWLGLENARAEQELREDAERELRKELTP